MVAFDRMQIVYAVNVFNVQNLEYIMYSGYQLDVGTIPRQLLRGIREGSVLVVMTWEIEESWVGEIAFEGWIVLV